MEGGPGGELEKRSIQDLQKEWVPFKEGLYIGEASACYKFRCLTARKVARPDTSFNVGRIGPREAARGAVRETALCVRRKSRIYCIFAARQALFRV